METLKGLFPTEDPEPACDHVRCLDCGWSGCWADCVTEEETESVDGHVTARQRRDVRCDL